MPLPEYLIYLNDTEMESSSVVPIGEEMDL